MIKIGEFSKVAQVPIATLRYYDQVGLLKPVQVDRLTGYRYYSVSQLPRLDRILALKGLGFSLEQIKLALTEAITPEEMRGMLRLRHVQIQQQLADAQSQLLEVEMRLRHIERETQLPNYDVRLKQLDPMLIASVRSTLLSRNEVGGMFGEVYEAIRPYLDQALLPNPERGGQTLVLWYDREYREIGFDGAAAFMLRCSIPESGRVRVEELPAVMVASVVHHGSYERMGYAHEAVMAWVEANGYQITGPDRELNLYHATPIRLDDPTYVTEIQYPVEKIYPKVSVE